MDKQRILVNGFISKLDLVEIQYALGDGFEVQVVCPTESHAIRLGAVDHSLCEVKEPMLNGPVGGRKKKGKQTKWRRAK